MILFIKMSTSDILLKILTADLSIDRLDLYLFKFICFKYSNGYYLRSEIEWLRFSSNINNIFLCVFKCAFLN
jgi:hypothetical protein